MSKPASVEVEHWQPEERAKLEWLRNAVQESTDSLDRGEGETFDSIDDLARYIRSLIPSRERNSKI